MIIGYLTTMAIGTIQRWLYTSQTLYTFTGKYKNIYGKTPGHLKVLAVWLIIANLGVLYIGVIGHMAYLMSPAASQAAKVATQL